MRLACCWGRIRRDIPRGKTLEELTAPPEVPAGLPSGLAGAASRHPPGRTESDRGERADRRGQGAVFSADHVDGISGRAEPRADEFVHGAGAAMERRRRRRFDLPIFNAGRVRANVRLTEAQQREALATYQKTIETAFPRGVGRAGRHTARPASSGRKRSCC